MSGLKGGSGVGEVGAGGRRRLYVAVSMEGEYARGEERMGPQYSVRREEMRFGSEVGMLV